MNWRQETLHFLVIAMEVAWLAPLAALLSNLAKGAPLPAWALLLLYVTAFWSGRLILRLRLDAARSRLLAVYLAAFSILVALKLAHYGDYPWLDLTWLARLATDMVRLFGQMPPAALTILVGVYLWWRGLRLSGDQVTLSLVASRFQVGLMGFVAVLVLSAFLPLADVSVAVFAYFFCGLLAIAIARLEEMTRGKASSLNGYWLSVLLVATVSVLLLGGLSISALTSSGNVLIGLLNWLQPVLELLDRLLLLLLIPIGYLAEFLINLIRSFLAGAKAPELQVQVTPDPDWMEEAQKAGGLPIEMQQIIRSAILILLLLLAVWLIARAVSRRLSYQEEGVEETRESLWSAGGFWSDLADLFHNLWQRFTGAARQRAGALAAALRGEEQRTALSIRQIYSALQRLAASLGFSRRADQTPYEYLPDLRRALPQALADLANITETYVRARYSPLPSTPEEVQTAREAWERVRKG